MQNLSRMQWIQERNPYLAFRLLSTEAKEFYFPKVRLNILSDSEILFIKGVTRSFDSLKPFLEKGNRVVFVEESVERVGAFLALSDFVEHENIEIILDEESEYQKIAKKYTFKKQQFIGKLEKIKRYLDEFHMVLSEYHDLGKTILQNIQSNLMQTTSFVNGKGLEGKYKGIPVVICGSGPSLEKNREKLLEMQKRALIFAAGSSIPKLIEWGVSIDAGFFVDPWPDVSLYDSIKNVSFPLFYQNRMSKELFKMHQGLKVWMGSSQGWAIEEWVYKQIGLEPFFFDGGWNVGCFALQAAYFLGCDSISLIGMDGGERRDLEGGLVWMQAFMQNHPDRVYNQIMGERQQVVIKHDTTIDRALLKDVIVQLNDARLHRVTEAFLDRLKKPIDAKGYEREKILWEAECVGEPLYEYLVEPLWNLFKIEVEEEIIAKALFVQRVLKYQEVFRFYPSGALYAKERQDGCSELFYETGEVKARVHFCGGILHGDFCLYAKDGTCLREGRYVNGKKEGVHIIRNDQGIELLRADFKEDKNVNRYVRKNASGRVVEELFYHNPEQFDRRLYSEIGELECEGVFTGERYVEKRYHQGVCIEERRGIFEEGRLVWD